MFEEIEAVTKALNAAQVRYLVVGGVAVVLHGYLRTTGDLDLVIQLEHTNLSRALEALQSLGFRPKAPVRFSDFANSETRQSWITTKGLTVLSLASPRLPAFEVDLFASEPFDFDSVYARAADVKLDHVAVRVIGLDDLIDLKLRVGRPQDTTDVAALQAVRQALKSKEPRHQG